MIYIVHTIHSYIVYDTLYSFFACWRCSVSISKAWMNGAYHLKNGVNDLQLKLIYTIHPLTVTIASFVHMWCRQSVSVWISSKMSIVVTRGCRAQNNKSKLNKTTFISVRNAFYFSASANTIIAIVTSNSCKVQRSRLACEEMQLGSNHYQWSGLNIS